MNVHALPDQLLDHLARRQGADAVVTSMEDEALGTAGAVGRLRGWLDGRAVVVVNGDTWCPAPSADLVAGWDGERVRVHVAGPDAVQAPVAASWPRSCPGPWPASWPAEPSGLYEVVWRAAHQQGRLETVHWHGAVRRLRHPGGLPGRQPRGPGPGRAHVAGGRRGPVGGLRPRWATGWWWGRAPRCPAGSSAAWCGPEPGSTGGRCSSTPCAPGPAHRARALSFTGVPSMAPSTRPSTPPHGWRPRRWPPAARRRRRCRCPGCGARWR